MGKKKPLLSFCEEAPILSDAEKKRSTKKDKNTAVEQKICIDSVCAHCNSFSDYVKIIDAETARIKLYMCSHTTKKGRLRADFNENEVCTCRKCGTRFSFTAIKASEFNQAYTTLMDAFNQMKVFSSPERPDLVNRIGLLMGEIDIIINDPLFIKSINCCDEENKYEE